MPNQRLKIAVFYNNPYGGSGRAIYEQVRRLQHYHEVTLFTMTKPESGFWGLDELSPRRPVLYEGFRAIPKPFGRLHSVTSLIELAKLNRAHLRVAHGLNDIADLALVFQCPYTSSPLLLRHLRIPSVLWTHEPLRSLHEPTIKRPGSEHRSLGKYSELLDHWDPFLNLRNLIYRRVDQSNARHATSVVTNSYYSREVLYRVYGVDAAVNYLGVDTNLFRPLHIKKHHEVLSLGHVSPSKAHDFVIESIGLLPAEIRPKLIVAGAVSQSKERVYLQRLALERQVDIAFHSANSDLETIRYYNRAKVLAFAPILEPFGLAPLEAMASETPVVAVKEAGIRETVRDGEVGYLVDRSISQFAERLRQLLTKDDLRNEMGKRAREYVKNQWNWEHSIKQLDGHIQQVIGND